MSQSGVKVLKLQEPIIVGSGEPIEQLTFQKPKAKHFRRFPTEPTMGDVLDLLGKLCGRSSIEMDELSVVDMMEATQIVMGFIPSGLKSGSERSA
jgi:hypothetical protein